MTPGGTPVEEQWPPLRGRVGRSRLPSTTQALARFFRAFPRVDATRRGLHAGRRATGARRRVRGVSRFTPPATTGRAPSAVLVPAARRRPRSRVLNDPCRALQERTAVTPEATMADFWRPQAAAASRRRGETRQRSH
jgi:hypothetical protein